MNRLTYRTVLSCGCEITYHCVDDVPGIIAKAPEYVAFAARGIAHWAEHRLPRHKCELVSPENPNGIEKLRPLKFHDAIPVVMTAEQLAQLKEDPEWHAPPAKPAARS